MLGIEWERYMVIVNGGKELESLQCVCDRVEDGICVFIFVLRI